MSISLLNEFKKRCERIDGKTTKEDSIKTVERLAVRLYNVHKRSLPVGIDKPVYFGVTHTNAEMLCEKFLKASVRRDQSNDNSMIIYYDIVPCDATSTEKSIYWNPAEKIKAV